jgi:formylglycine-generating enzyme required for sulfatase activity
LSNGELEGKTPAYYSDAGYNDIYGKSGSTWSLPNSGDIYWDQSADGYRLPTEAEWEYAARGGIFATSTVYAGSNNINDVAWYNSNSDNKTHPVGTKMENELGLYDMSGNVWEWVYDWYDGNYYSSSPSSNPTGPLSGSNRVIRGGNWNLSATNCRVAHRSNFFPDFRRNDYGFRLVLSYEEPDTGNTIEIDETFTILELSCFDVDCPLVLDPTLGSEIGPVRPIRPDDIDLPEPPEPPSCISDVFGECDDGNDNTCNDYSLFCICISQNTFPIITSQLPWEPPLGVGPGEPDMTLINGGEFTMGLCIDDTYTPILSSFLDYMLYGISISGLINNIGTVQTQNVTLDDFYMSRFEVTRSQFETITSVFGGPSAAMINVAWPNAITFCNRLSVYHGYEPVYYYDQSYNNIYGFDGSSWKWSDHEEVFWNPNANGYRLPTEAEWEYAARGGNLEINTIFSGSNNIDDVAWCCGNYSDLLGYTGSVNPNAWPSLSVGLKQPNELGLYDMNGNVSEWVWDWLGEYSEIPVDNPMGPLTGEISIENAQKVYRGGSKNSNTWDNNILFRNSSPEGMWHGFKVGIRLVRSAINCNSNSDCDDNNVCNGVETCDPVLGCQPGTPLNCNDGDPCTVDGCHVITGCYSF